MKLLKHLITLPETTSGSSTETTVVGANSIATFPSSDDPSSLKLAMVKAMKIALASPTQSPGLGFWNKPGWDNSLDDVGPPTLHLFGFRHKSNNPSFKDACKTGEIVMGEYSVCEGILRYGPLDRFSESIYPLARYPVAADVCFLHEEMRYFAPSPYTDKFHYVNGLWRAGTYTVQYAERHRTVGHPVDPRVNLAEVSTYLQSPPTPLEHVTVQEVLAKANGGDLDVLTAMAEAPKTVQSILDGFKLILKIFKDAKKKEFSIFATVPSREKRLLNEAWTRYRVSQLSRIPPFSVWRKRSSNKGLSIHDYNRFVALRKERIESLEVFSASRPGVYRARALREIAEALSSIYLNMQYNIKPLVYTIEDSVKAIENISTVYRRYGNGNTPVVTDLRLELPGIPEAKFVGTAQNEFRCLIKRRYSSDDVVTKLNNVLTADLLVTGFELIKLWSIVFDWFFTIGDALRAIPWNRSYVQQASCVSWKTTIKGHFLWEREGVTHTLHVDMERFERDLYNPAYSIGIYFRDGFGLMQQLAALAFAFQSVNGGIRKRYYK